MKRAVALASGALLLLVNVASAGHTLTRSQERILRAWLATRHVFRAATVADCACADDVAVMRKGAGGQWRPVSDYQPYRATGDFNGDGHDDFAVVVVDTSKPIQEAFGLLVFNGPIDTRPDAISPAFEKQGLRLRGAGLFFGAPRARPYRLLVGAFESEGAMLQPSGRSYRLSEN